MDESDRRRIVNLAEKLVASMIEKGEVDPDDNEQLRKAAKEAAAMARSAHFAALEFLS